MRSVSPRLQVLKATLLTRGQALIDSADFRASAGDPIGDNSGYYAISCREFSRETSCRAESLFYGVRKPSAV